jgi:hypothetical protein
MKINNMALFGMVIVALLAFACGYYLGTENTLQHLHSRSQKWVANTNQPIASATSFVPISMLPHSIFIENIAPAEVLLAPLKTAVKIEEIPVNSGPVLADNAGVVDIIRFLNLLEASDNPDSLDKFVPALNSLREAADNNPENFQILMDYFAESDPELPMPYYITNVLQSANLTNKDILMNNLVLRLSAQGSVSGDARLLHLLSSTGMHYENDDIISTIKNIALYSQVDSGNRTYALDLLMPYQLMPNERSKVVTDLSYALTRASREDVSYILENIIRFSDKDERIKLASEYLASTNNFETRVAILSTMHNGSIKPNDALKAELFSIAQNSSDPLSKHAIDTLMYVFEIDNDEYKRLQNGGG